MRNILRFYMKDKNPVLSVLLLYTVVHLSLSPRISRLFLYLRCKLNGFGEQIIVHD